MFYEGKKCLKRNYDFTIFCQKIYSFSVTLIKTSPTSSPSSFFKVIPENSDLMPSCSKILKYNSPTVSSLLPQSASFTTILMSVILGVPEISSLSKVKTSQFGSKVFEILSDW